MFFHSFTNVYPVPVVWLRPRWGLQKINAPSKGFTVASCQPGRPAVEEGKEDLSCGSAGRAGRGAALPTPTGAFRAEP